ncbi:MAG: hypothetical protein IKM67_00610, partial [Clostridia bacterium]|nr:hypothetical protein [Clostridia bacterium]
IGFGIYLLIKSGKMGLAHLEKPYMQPYAPFTVEKLIPCEYDRISSPYHEGIVILEKDSNRGLEVAVYLSHVGVITPPFSNYHLLDRRLIQLSKKGARMLVDAKTGKMITRAEKGWAWASFCSYLGCDPIPTEDLYFILEMCEGDHGNIIVYNGDIIHEYKFDGGEPYFLFDINCFDLSSPMICGIIISSNDEYFFIDKKGKISSFKHIEKIELYSYIDFIDNFGDVKGVISYNRKKLPEWEIPDYI